MSTTTKTWRLGGVAGYSVHAVGTETRGVRTYTHVELHADDGLIGTGTARSWSLTVHPLFITEEIARIVPGFVADSNVKFLCGLVRTTYAQRAI